MAILTIRFNSGQDGAVGAVVQVTEVAGYTGDGAITIRREGHARRHLGPEGWEAEATVAQATRWALGEDDVLELYLGAEVTDFLIPDDPLTITVPGISVSVTVPWPSAEMKIITRRLGRLPFGPAVRSPHPPLQQPEAEPSVRPLSPPATRAPASSAPSSPPSTRPEVIEMSGMVRTPLKVGEWFEAGERTAPSFPSSLPPPRSGRSDRWILGLVFLVVCFTLGTILWQRLGGIGTP